MLITVDIQEENWNKFLELTKDAREGREISGERLLEDEFDTPDVLVEMLGYENY